MRFFVLVLLCGLSFCVSAQNYYEVLDQSIKDAIDAGDACLKAPDASDCSASFQKAIALAAKMPDSILAMTYHEVGVSHSRFGKLPDFLNTLNEGLKKTTGTDHPLVTSALYRKKVYAFARMGPIDSILPTSDRALEFAQMGNDNEAITEVYIQRADLLHRMGQFKEALEVLQTAKPFAEPEDMKQQKAGIIFTMGNIYLSNFDFEEARVTLEEAIEAAKGIDELYHRAVVNWSMTMIHLDQPEPVIERLPETINFFKDRNLEWTAKTHLANAYSKLGNYERSIPLHEECLAASENIFDPTIISLNNRLLAKGYLDTNQPEKALPYAEEAFDYESNKGALDEQVIGAHVIYAQALGRNNQKDKAFDILEQFPALVDSMNLITKQREIKKLQELYETEKKEAQIALLEQKEEISSLQKGLLGFGILALIGILVALWIRFRESRKRATLERDKLDAEIHYKNKELTTHTLHLAKKNEILAELKDKVSELQGGCDTRAIINKINFDLKDEENWEHFTQYFEKVHTDFTKTVMQQFPNITPNELRLMALLKMNLTSKEIANMLNITADGVKKARQRLRKKLELTPEDSLEALVTSF